MWLADNWKDYEVLDTSNGEKLERWGNYLLVRPDPQVVWNTPHTNPGWKKKNGHYHRSSKGGGEWEFFSLPQQWSIHYGKLTFQLSASHIIISNLSYIYAIPNVFRIARVALQRSNSLVPVILNHIYKYKKEQASCQ